MVDAIVARLNELLEQRGLPAVERPEIVWVFDESVSWGDTSAVSEEHLLTEPAFEREIRRRGEGASWIHANLARMPDGRSLVAVDVGNRVGNPSPTVNVSIEPDRVVRLDRGTDRG